MSDELRHSQSLSCPPTPASFGLAPTKRLSPKQTTPPPIELKRGRVGLWDSIAMIVGVVIGSGIFVSPGGVAAFTGSPGLALVVWTLCGAISTLGAACYAELGTSLSRSGGDFVYVKAAFGELPGFLYLWVALIVIVPTGNAITALTFARYLLQPFFSSLTCESQNNSTAGEALSVVQDAPNSAICLVAMACTSLLVFVNCYNVNWATKLQDVFTVTKLTALGMIIILGLTNLFRGKPNSLAPSVSFDGSTTNVGIIALSFYSGLFSFSGWNYLNFVTEEIKEPHKTLPRAIFISLPLVTLVYVLTNMAYFTIMSPREVEMSKAVAITFVEKSAGKIAWLIQLLVSASTFGGLNGCLFTASRLFFAGAREGQLPTFLALINVERFSPVTSIIFTGIVSIIMCGTPDVLALINYTSFVESAFMTLSVTGLVWLRFRDPELHRPVKVSLWIPAMFLATCLFLLILPLLTSPQDCGIGLIMILAGIPVYYFSLGWDKKPKFISKLTRCLLITFQKMFNGMPQYMEWRNKI